ncbi:single-strand DNA-binding protein [Abditibacterium utsteinense]|uniref:Single-stranded DNA-binding protein n=1 Tax=Abditibacterium utsteinense TaxID=1960156 RepID=A0A2S8SU52_9BACT|nr:single-stranded DNA-binding protein [Abditibacterium utsteinense]PQV64333.1 single-strand DNA-binding protein [Abditibacterium utsteinense]
MPSFNKVTLIGRLVRDPELSYTSAGLAVAKFTIAVDRQFKNPQTGERKTDFFRCNAWRQKAEFVSNYIQKGRLVAIDGRIELNEYTAQDGQKRFSTDVVCENVELLDSNRDAPGDAAPAGGGNHNAQDNGGGGDGYFADEEASPAPTRRPVPPQQAAPAPRPQQQQRPAQAAPAPAARPAQRPAPAPAKAEAYPADDDFDDSDPFADE